MRTHAATGTEVPCCRPALAGSPEPAACNAQLKQATCCMTGCGLKAAEALFASKHWLQHRPDLLLACAQVMCEGDRFDRLIRRAFQTCDELAFKVRGCLCVSVCCACVCGVRVYVVCACTCGMRVCVRVWGGAWVSLRMCVCVHVCVVCACISCVHVHVVCKRVSCVSECVHARAPVM